MMPDTWRHGVPTVGWGGEGHGRRSPYVGDAALFSNPHFVSVVENLLVTERCMKRKGKIGVSNRAKSDLDLISLWKEDGIPGNSHRSVEGLSQSGQALDGGSAKFKVALTYSIHTGTLCAAACVHRQDTRALLWLFGKIQG